MKKLLAVIVAVLILALALPAFAADTPAAGDNELQAQINSLYAQIRDLQKQIVDKYVAAGRYTPDQGEAYKENIDRVDQYRQQNPEAFQNMVNGCGRMMGGSGYGPGMMGSAGYGMMGGWNSY